ncbi:MAG: FG-GAP-like repeat-containing protein [Actinomycetota bacterium]
MGYVVFDARRALALLAALVLLLTGVAVAPAGAAEGVPPEIIDIVDADLDIDPGEKRALEVVVVGVDDGAVFGFSGTGLAVTGYRAKSGGIIRLHLQATTDAEGGFRDLTVTNPDGLSGTYPDAMFVTGDIEPPPLGDLTIHVFEDLDGDGIEGGAETGLAGVSVAVDDFGGGSSNVVTDASGNATVIGLPVGDATLTYATPAAMALTTANGVQIVTIVLDATTAAASVGYETIPTGDIEGRVFEDLDANGVEDGADTGLAGVAVTVTDAGGADHDVVTDGSGDFMITQLPLGDADVVYTAPVGSTLTTANDSQVVTVTDGGLAGAAPVGYEPPSGEAPQILGMQDVSPEIDPGQKKHFNVDVLNYIDGGTASFSGSGLTVKVKVIDSDTIRLSVSAAADAESGLRDLTVTNPGGGSDTLVGAVTVTGTVVPPISGDVSGRVFEDIDGNGIEDGADTGMADMGVSFVDEAGDTWPGMTDSNGDFTVAVGVGEGTLTVSGSPGATLTTGNNIQVLTISEGLETVAAPVGYLPPSGDATFINVAPAAGITTDHDVGGLCGMPIGIGSAWADADGDGDQDLFTTNRVGANHFYRNDGDTDLDGVVDFSDIAVQLGVDAPTEDSFAAVFIDYDNDGDQDLFVANSSGNTLWENQFADSASLTFVDVSGSAGLDDIGRIQTATWGDIDNDGFLDVYYSKHASCAVGGTNTDLLFHNNGDGSFSDWTTYLCAGGAVPCDDVNGLGFTAGMFDYDNDGDVDIYLVNDNIGGSNQPNKLWRNDGSDGLGGWLFVEDGAAANVDASVNGMGLGIGDYNNDGFLDLAFSDAGPGHLLMNDGDGTFTDVSSSSGVTGALAGGVSWGTAFMDYNNDGWQDLFFAQGGIGSPDPLASVMLENGGDGTFADVTDITGMGDEARARSVAKADFNGDGWVDVFVGNYDAYPLLMQNNAADNGNLNEWLTITVEGTESNRDGIGAVIAVTTIGGTQTQLISSGANHGGGSQKAAFFGLGAETSATVSIAWPNGVVENLGSVNAGQVAHFVEPTS